MSNDQKRTILAIAISALILFGWQYYFSPVKTVETNTIATTPSLSDKGAPAPTTQEATTTIQTSSLPVIEASTFILKDNESEVTLTSDFKILEIKSLLLQKNATDFFMGNGTSPLLKLSFIEQTPISLNLVKVSETLAEDKLNGVKIFLNKGNLDWSISSQKPVKPTADFFALPKSDNSGRILQYIYFASSDVKRIDLGKSKRNDAQLRWMGLDYDYHLFALTFDQELTSVVSSEASGFVNLQTVTPASSFSGRIILVKKEYDTLIALGDKLELSVNFGFFAILAVPFLRALQFFYDYFPNYGVAIIILTFIIRLLTFPLQFKSFKSMKKMQDLQPAIAKIKEKFKDNPKKVQEETMNLFKNSGANPLGGCLPMILQIPVFMAFYSVLSTSVELVSAPFYGWIIDLSAKDQYYVLPVLMCLSMLLQQKLTPSATMDKMQQRIMYLMPIVFGFIMKDLPAGLNLYTFVSIILGIGQQMLVYKYVK